MDFNAISSTLKLSTPLEIIHPVTGEGGWILDLAAPHHPGAQAKVNAVLDRSKKRKISTSGQDERDGVELIAARVLGWTGLMNGEDEVPYSEEACIAILASPKSFWVRSQVLDALGDTSRPFTV